MAWSGRNSGDCRYMNSATELVFNGNSGRNDIVKHSFKEYASARFIRFQPTTYSGHKALRVEVFGVLVSTVPSQAPSGFTVAASTSTSITASWQLPPEYARHGNITGFKLFYKEKDSVGSPFNITIDDGGSYSRDITGLSIYTEYEFQVLAFTFEGDGPKSSVMVERTAEDAPDVPVTLNYTNIAPDKSHGPRVNLTWSEPIKANGIIRNYTLFYGHEKGTQKETFGKNTLSYSIDVLGGLTYQFSVRAVTVKPGENATLTVNVPEYEPSRGPEIVSIIELNFTTFQISWDGLSEEVANGFIEMYQVRLAFNASCTPVQPGLYSTFNATTTDVVLSSLSVCTRYEMSVRGFTAVGPGPYSKPIMLQTLGVKWSKETPASLLISTNSSEDEIKVTMTLPQFPVNAEFFQVIVIAFSSDFTGVVNPPESFTPQDLLTYEEAHETPDPAAYVTFQFGGNDFDKYQEFVVGDGSESNSKARTKRSQDDNVGGSYYNKPLQRNTNYRVFLRAFVTETVYISSNFVEIEVKDKPVVVELPHQVIISVGKLVLLTCEVSGDPEPSVTWTKNGNSTIPRAQFKNDGRILVIQDVSPRDSGVYECKASNKFGQSRTSTTVIVAVPPSIIEDVSPSLVICEMQTLCTFSCHATSGSPFNYSWTKNGQVPVSDDIKIMNNIIALTPRDAEDYGVYVCRATNGFGSTAYKITLSEYQKSSTAADTVNGDEDVQHILRVAVIPLSCIVFVLLVVIGVFIWRIRRAEPNNRTTTANKVITDDIGQPKSPRAQHVSEPGVYMELHPRPTDRQSRAPAEYQTLQGRHMTSEYYNGGFKSGNNKEDEEVYDEVGNSKC